MSSGQLLLTLGVALLVFDSKKLPNLMINVALVFVTCRRYYQEGVLKFEQMLQQVTLEKQLEQNKKKAQAIEEEY